MDEDLEEGVTVGEIIESVETNLWMADAYDDRGARLMALKCREDA